MPCRPTTGSAVQRRMRCRVCRERCMGGRHRHPLPADRETCSADPGLPINQEYQHHDPPHCHPDRCRSRMTKLPRGLVDDPSLTIDQDRTTGMGRPSQSLVKSVTGGRVSYQHQFIQPVKGHVNQMLQLCQSNLFQMWPGFALGSQQMGWGWSPGPRKDIRRQPTRNGEVEFVRDTTELE